MKESESRQGCNIGSTQLPDLTYTAVPDHASFIERLNHVPQQPGVYLWKDIQGNVLYIGKSKNLRERMRSYFGSPHSLSAKTHRLVSQIADFSIVLARNELEALLLEMNFIKQHRPRYNILLKDDKSYPYIKVTVQEAMPRIIPTRTVVEDGSRYFGPYANVGSVHTTLDLLNRLFAFRPPFACSETKFARHRRLGKPCLYYDMKRCLAPCVPALVSETEYRQTVDAVCQFLEGKSEQIVRELRQRMEHAADALHFERAALLRDQIRAIERVLEKQQVLRTDHTDQDVIAFARDGNHAVVEVLFIRSGKLIGAEPFPLQGTDDESDANLLASFLTQFYDQVPDIPPTLLLADHIEEPTTIAQWLSQKRGKRVTIQVPRRGEKRRLIELAAQNAMQKLNELRSQWLNREQQAAAGLTELRELLGLPTIPQRIECYDVSHTQGHHPVASMVVFERGKANPSAYRRFTIETMHGGNDIASLQEVLHRRFARSIPSPTPSSACSPETTSCESYPDLLLVDGGKGQVLGALRTLQVLGLTTIPVAGVVKGGDRDRFDLVLPDREHPIVLPRTSHVLRLIRHIDEEAHRFATTYHRKRRTKATLASSLDTIPGIGPKRKRALLHAFGSLDAIRAASIEELMTVPGITLTIARTLKTLLPPSEN